VEREYFQNLEHLPEDAQFAIDDILEQLAFNEQGLIPVIAQDAQSKDVLMVAWMNREALEHTLTTRHVTYWSRSRQQLWKKGETSGHIQTLVSMSFDCDGDAILCLVDQKGPACHTGRRHCFYLHVNDDGKTLTVASGN